MKTYKKLPKGFKVKASNNYEVKRGDLVKFMDDNFWEDAEGLIGLKIGTLSNWRIAVKK